MTKVKSVKASRTDPSFLYRRDAKQFQKVVSGIETHLNVKLKPGETFPNDDFNESVYQSLVQHQGEKYPGELYFFRKDEDFKKLCKRAKFEKNLKLLFMVTFLKQYPGTFKIFAKIGDPKNPYMLRRENEFLKPILNDLQISLHKDTHEGRGEDKERTIKPAEELDNELVLKLNDYKGKERLAKLLPLDDVEFAEHMENKYPKLFSQIHPKKRPEPSKSDDLCGKFTKEEMAASAISLVSHVEYVASCRASNGNLPAL